MGQLWGEKTERRQGEANTGSLCGELNRNRGQEDGALCSSLLALCQDRMWWWGWGSWPPPWPQPLWVDERKRAAEGWLWGELVGGFRVRWIKAREPLRSEPPQKPVVVGDSRV